MTLKSLFHKNRLFTETALSGWFCVYNSKSRKEIVFWYSIIVLFISLTLYNVCQLVIVFASWKISFKLSLASSSAHIEIPELYLTLQVPVLELYNSLPSGIAHDNCARTSSNMDLYDQSFNVLFDYLCMYTPTPSSLSSHGQSRTFAITDGEQTVTPGDQRIYQDAAGRTMLKALQDALLHEPFHNIVRMRGPNRQQNHTLNEPKTLEHWRKQMGQSKQDLLEYMHGVMATPVNQQYPCKIMLDIHKLSNKPLGHKSNDSLAKLLLLEAFNTGEDPGVKLLTGVSNNSAANVLDRLGITARELLENCLEDLADVLHVKVEPSASVILQNWTFDSNVDMDSEIGSSQQTLTLKIDLPKQVKRIRIQVYSYATMWLNYLLHAWAELVAHYADTNPTMFKQFEQCYFPGFNPYLVDNIWSYWHFWHLSFYQDVVTNLGLQLPFGTYVKLSSGTGHRISLIPSIYLHSQIESCFNASLTSCVDQCLMESHTEQCACAPWSLSSRAAAETSLCAKPCIGSRTRERCTESCSEKITHSCSLLIAHADIQYGRKTQRHITNVLEVFDLEVHIAEGNNYVQAEAEYEMPLNRFLSLLGGSIEFWGAFTITAILHMLVIIVIHCRSNTQTENSLVEFNAVKEKLETSVNSLREKIQKHKERGLKRIWLWFKNSKFPHETQMVGYSYIAAVDNMFEVFFWLSIMALFGIFATVNIYYITERFVANHIHISAVPLAYEPSIGIPNFTMHLHMPLCELSSKSLHFHTLFDLNKNYDIATLNDIQTTIQRFSAIERNRTIRSIGTVLANHLALQLSNSSHEKGSLSSKHKHEEWEKIQSETFEQMVGSTVEAFQNPFGTKHFQKTLADLLLKPLGYGNRENLFPHLLLLHGIKHGNAIFGNLKLNSSQLKIIMDRTHRDTNQLLDSTLRILGNIIDISSSSGVRFSLADIHFNAPWSFGLQLLVHVPQGTNEVEIRVRSLMKEWIAYVYDLYCDAIKAFKPQFPTKASLQALLIHLLVQDYYEWYGPETYALLTSPSFAIPYPISQSDREVKTAVALKWQLLSATDDCEKQENYDACMDQCKVQAYMATCNCIPWHMAHIMSESNDYCSTPCHQVQEQTCDTKCLKAPCKTQTYVLDTSELLENAGNYKNALQFRLYTQQRLHMKLLEQYDFTLGSFMAELGGISDFWLGLNLFAVLHATIYLIRNCFKHHQPPSKLTYWRRMKARVKQTRAQVRKSMRRLRSAESEGRLVVHKQKQRFSWLWQNQYFSETPMELFGFLNAASSRIQVVFWYATIFCCFGHTLFMMTSAIHIYRTKPTKIQASVSTVDRRINPMPNMTLSLEIPLLEFFHWNPIPLATPDPSIDSAIDSLVCAMDPESNLYVNPPHLHELFKEWLIFRNWNMTFDYTLNSDLSSDRNMEQWNGTLKDGTSHLWNFLERIRDLKSDSTNMDYLRSTFYELLDGPMRTFYNMQVPFFLLDSFKTATHPQSNLDDILKQEPSKVFVSYTENLSPTTPLNELMNGSSPLDVYKLAQHFLSQILHVEVHGTEGSSVVLQDWKLNPVTAGVNDWLAFQWVKLGVNLPEKNNATELHFEIQTYSEVWQKLLLGTISNFYRQLNRTTLPCSSGSIERLIFGRLELYSWDWWNSGYEQNRKHITLSSEDGHVMQFSQFKQQRKTLHLTVGVASATDSCVNGSHSHCWQMCMLERYMTACGCAPWTMVYLMEKTVCGHPCMPESNLDDERICEKECQHHLLHPCFKEIYEMEPQQLLDINRVQQDIFDPPNYQLPVYSFTITKSKKSGRSIHYVESYELSVASFIGQLSGLFDLWIGINLLSVIHLLAYVFKLFLARMKPAIQQENVTNMKKIEALKIYLEHELANIAQDIQYEILELLKDQRYSTNENSV